MKKSVALGVMLACPSLLMGDNQGHGQDTRTVCKNELPQAGQGSGSNGIQLYDDLDDLANDMATCGIQYEGPQKVSRVKYWIRKIGSPVLIALLNFKNRLSLWWSALIKKRFARTR